MLFLCGGCRDIVTSIGLSRLPHDHLPRETHEEKIREGGNRVAGAVGGARRVTHAVRRKCKARRTGLQREGVFFQTISPCPEGVPLGSYDPQPSTLFIGAAISVNFESK